MSLNISAGRIRYFYNSFSHQLQNRVVAVVVVLAVVELELVPAVIAAVAVIVVGVIVVVVIDQVIMEAAVIMAAAAIGDHDRLSDHHHAVAPIIHVTVNRNRPVAVGHHAVESGPKFLSALLSQ